MQRAMGGHCGTLTNQTGWVLTQALVQM
jgi:hypothetical protein